jgi:hypothetical protein
MGMVKRVMFKEECDQILTEVDSIFPSIPGILFKKIEDITDENALRYIQKGFEVRKSTIGRMESYLQWETAYTIAIGSVTIAILAIIPTIWGEPLPWYISLVILIFLLGLNVFLIKHMFFLRKMGKLIRDPKEMKYPEDIFIMMIEAKLQKLHSQKETTKIE